MRVMGKGPSFVNTEISSQTLGVIASVTGLSTLALTACQGAPQQTTAQETQKATPTRLSIPGATPTPTITPLWTPLPPVYATTTALGNPNITPVAGSPLTLSNTITETAKILPRIGNECAVVPQPITAALDPSLLDKELGNTMFGLDFLDSKIHINLFDPATQNKVVEKIIAKKDLLYGPLKTMDDESLRTLIMQVVAGHEEIHACYGGRSGFTVQKLRDMGIDIITDIPSDQEVQTFGFGIYTYDVVGLGDKELLSNGLEELTAYLLPSIDPDLPVDHPFKLLSKYVSSAFRSQSAFFRYIGEKNPYLYGDILKAKAKGDIFELFSVLDGATQRALYNDYIGQGAEPEIAQTKAIKKAGIVTSGFFSTSLQYSDIAEFADESSSAFEAIMNRAGLKLVPVN